MNPFNENSNWLILQPDVLGSEQEGWSVNAAYSTGRIINLDDFESDIEIVEALQEVGLIPDNVEAWQVDIDGDEEMIYVNDASNWQPLWHLQRTEEQASVRLQ
jgi:phospholipase C